MIGEEKGSVAISGRSNHRMTGLKTVDRYTVDRDFHGKSSLAPRT